MNKSLLKVGAFYAVRRGKYETMDKVQLLRIADGRSDHRAKWLTGRQAGTEGTFSSREIIQPWSEYEIEYERKKTESAQHEARSLLAQQQVASDVAEVDTFLAVFEVLGIEAVKLLASGNVVLDGTNMQVWVRGVPAIKLTASGARKLHQLLIQYVPSLAL